MQNLFRLSRMAACLRGGDGSPAAYAQMAGRAHPVGQRQQFYPTLNDIRIR